jgi:hypothetical protein
MQTKQSAPTCPPAWFTVYIGHGVSTKQKPIKPLKGASMKRLSLFVVLALGLSSAWAQVKPCEELKSEIAAKIEANGVKNYTLEIVENDKVGDGKVVGSCEGGTKKIVYTRK